MSRRVTVKTWLRRLAGGLLALAAVLAVVAALLGRTVRDAAQAYLYGFPLVIMDVTREAFVATQGPENTLVRVRRFPDAAFRAVVRPNVDTLYTTAFIDMDRGPWLFEMAANDLRYETMPLMDGWTNVFAAPGSRTTGRGGGRFLLVGPKWQGTPPEGLTLLRSPTRIAWLIGRTQTHGEADYPLVHRLQDGLRLTRWPAPAAGAASAADAAPAAPSAPAAASAPSAPYAAAATSAVTATPPQPPIEHMRAMDTPAFFERLARLMADNPPSPADAPMLETLDRLGLAPGRPPQWGPVQRSAAALGRWLADRQVARAVAASPTSRQGWFTPPSHVGRFGTDYATRAAVAMVGLGANLPDDAIYPATRVDGQGRRLDGSQRYRLHFAADALPPVQAFWSITAYGPDDFFIDRPERRYALGDRDPLVRNADGSLDLWIQPEPPPPALRANWLPVKAGQPFLLNARLYWPRAEALDGRWQLPPLERLD